MLTGLLLAGACTLLTIWALGEERSAEGRVEWPEGEAPEAAEAKEATVELKQCRVFAVVAERLPGPRENLRQVRGILAEAAQELGGSFKELSALAKSQSNWLDQTLQEIHGSRGDNAVSIATLAADSRENAAMVGQLAGLIVQLSKRSLDIFDRVESMVERLREMERLVAGVKAIADQTTLLALNATIEAAHVGEAGKGFEVVASEIRQLAQNAQKVSEEIRQQARRASETAGAALGLTQENAAQDLTILLEARRRMESMAANAIDLENRLRDKLGSAKSSAAEIGMVNAVAIRSMQFEDIARQILERTEQDLTNVETTLVAVGAAPATEDLTALATAVLEEQAALVAHKPSQESIAGGEVELF